MRRFAIFVVATAVAASQPAFAWGDKGHEIIAAIARDRLTPKAKAWVDVILATDTDTLTAPDMVSRATWADKWRNGHRETASWHFVDLELPDPGLKTACFGYPAASEPPSAGPAQDCIVDKLGEFEKELGNPSTAPAERVLALKFVLHFVGDIHQPLHASDNEDRGGNCVPVSLGGQRTSNLHSFWDTIVLTSLGDDPAAIAKALEADITPDEAKAWSAGPAEAWAEESYAVAKSDVYSIGSPSGCVSDRAPIELSDAYQAHALVTARTQIEKAGVRLAWVLNGAVASATKGRS